jgi:phytoene desaturase
MVRGAAAGSASARIARCAAPSAVRPDEHLRQALVLVGGNPFDTSSIYTLIHYLERHWGVTFPRGGTGALVRALVVLLQELGGEVRLSSPVERIRAVRNGATVHQVTTRRGTESFDLVVSNADLHHTYGELLRGEPSAARTTKRLESLDWSMSLFVLYFGTTDTPIGSRTTRWCSDRAKPCRQFGGSRLPTISLYLHAPTVTDPSMAPRPRQLLRPLAGAALGRAPLDWDKIATRMATGSSPRSSGAARPAPAVYPRWRAPERSEANAYHGTAFSCAQADRVDAAAQPRRAHPAPLPGRRRDPGQRAGHRELRQGHGAGHPQDFAT